MRVWRNPLLHAHLLASNPWLARSRLAAAWSAALRTRLVRARAAWLLCSNPCRSRCTTGYPWWSCGKWAGRGSAEAAAYIPLQSRPARRRASGGGEQQFARTFLAEIALQAGVVLSSRANPNKPQ